jgi:hypothetical protein
VEINLEEARGPIREWIAQEPVRREIRRRFARLLKTFQDENGDSVYKQRVRDMVRSEWARARACPLLCSMPCLRCVGWPGLRALQPTAPPLRSTAFAHFSPCSPFLAFLLSSPPFAANSATLEVNYLDIANTMPVVAIWLADHPREMLPILGETAK